MRESVLLFVALVVLVATLTAGAGVAAASHGSQACANAPSVDELPASDTATERAADGVTTARSRACGPH